MKRFMKWDIRCVVDDACELGEGPIWDADRQRLLWVDILGKVIHAYHPDNGQLESWQLDEMIGFILPCEDGRWIGGLASGLAYISLGEELNSDRSVTLEFIDRPEEDYSDNRFNDGACDPSGRLWCGTMHMPGTQPLGTLYCYDHSITPVAMDEGYIVSNGPAFSLDGRTLYHCESAENGTQPQGIYAFNLSEDGSIHDKRLLADYRNRKAAPDGLMVDGDDRLWVGEWGGARLACFDKCGKLLHEIPLPTTNVTKAAFGGKDLDTLYVTTATTCLSKEQRATELQAGGLFEITGLGRGLLPSRFQSCEKNQG